MEPNITGADLVFELVGGEMAEGGFGGQSGDTSDTGQEVHRMWSGL